MTETPRWYLHAWRPPYDPVNDATTNDSYRNARTSDFTLDGFRIAGSFGVDIPGEKDFVRIQGRSEVGDPTEQDEDMNRNTHSWCWGFCLSLASVFVWLFPPPTTVAAEPVSPYYIMDDGAASPSVSVAESPLTQFFLDACGSEIYGELPGFNELLDRLGIDVPSDGLALWHSENDGASYELHLDSVPSDETLISIRSGAVILPGAQMFGPEHGIRSAHIEISWTEFLYARSGEIVNLISYDLVTEMSRENDENGYPVLKPYRTLQVLGFVSNPLASKQFMNELASIVETTEMLRGEDTECYPKCNCACGDEFGSQVDAGAAIFRACMAGVLLWAIGLGAACGVICMAGGPAWQACLMGCLRFVQWKVLGARIAACATAFAVWENLAKEQLTNCLDDC